MTESKEERVFKVSGMTCGHCRGAVESAIREVSGVRDVRVDLTTGDAIVLGTSSDQQIISAVADAGYDAVLQTNR